jgi:hypothetical protein
MPQLHTQYFSKVPNAEIKNCSPATGFHIQLNAKKTTKRGGGAAFVAKQLLSSYSKPSW